MTPEPVLQQLVADRRAGLMRTGAQAGSLAAWWASRRARRASPDAPASPSPTVLADARASTGDAGWASTIGHLVAERGIAGSELAVQQLLRAVGGAGAGAVHVGIVADRSLPDAMRERALGHLLVRLADDTPSRRPDRHAAA